MKYLVHSAFTFQELGELMLRAAAKRAGIEPPFTSTDCSLVWNFKDETAILKGHIEKPFQTGKP